ADPDGPWGPELRPAELTRMVGLQSQIREPAQEDLDGHPGQMAPEPGPQAEVGADGEGEVRSLLPMDVEEVGIGPPAGIAIRRREDGPDQRAFWKRHSRQLEPLCGLPRRGADRPGPPQRLLDRRPDQRSIVT